MRAQADATLTLYRIFTRSKRADHTPCGAMVAAPGDPLCCRWRSALTRRRSSRLARRCSMLLTRGGAFTPAAAEAGDWDAGRLLGGEDCLSRSSVQAWAAWAIGVISAQFARTRLSWKEPAEPPECSTHMLPSRITQAFRRNAVRCSSSLLQPQINVLPIPCLAMPLPADCSCVTAAGAVRGANAASAGGWGWRSPLAGAASDDMETFAKAVCAAANSATAQPHGADLQSESASPSHF